MALLPVAPSEHEQEAAHQDQRGADGLRQLDVECRLPGVPSRQFGLRADHELREAARAQLAGHVRDRVAGDADVEVVAAGVQQRRGQRHQLRIVAVVRQRLGHAAAAVHQLAVEVHFEVAADPFDVQRQQFVRRRRRLEAGVVPDRGVTGAAPVEPLVGQRAHARAVVGAGAAVRGFGGDGLVDDQPLGMRRGEQQAAQDQGPCRQAAAQEKARCLDHRAGIVQDARRAPRGGQCGLCTHSGAFPLDPPTPFRPARQPAPGAPERPARRPPARHRARAVGAADAAWRRAARRGRSG